MSNIFYATRLYFLAHRNYGTAKLHGHEVPLLDAPVICGHTVDIDYTPEVHIGRIREKFDGWRDMEAEEMADADRLLHELIPDD